MEKQIGGNFGMRGYAFNPEKGMMFKDYACCIAEIFWIGLSIYGIVKIINDK